MTESADLAYMLEKIQSSVPIIMVVIFIAFILGLMMKLLDVFAMKFEEDDESRFIKSKHSFIAEKEYTDYAEEDEEPEDEDDEDDEEDDLE
jgi:hypothetical protein